MVMGMVAEMVVMVVVMVVVIVVLAMLVYVVVVLLVLMVMMMVVQGCKGLTVRVHAPFFQIPPPPFCQKIYFKYWIRSCLDTVSDYLQ